jgi:hypothetical protein
VADADDIRLPLPGAPVTLVVDEDRHGAVVDDVDGGRLELTPVALPDRVRMAGEADGMIEFVSESGPCRMFGHAAVTGEGGRVRFVPSGTPQLLLRGDRVRAMVEMVIELDVGGQTLTGTTRDVRGNGVLVAGPLEAQLGDMLQVRLQLPGRENPVEGWGRVARITESGDVALRLEEIGADERAALMLAVFEAQRRR